MLYPRPFIFCLVLLAQQLPKLRASERSEPRILGPDAGPRPTNAPPTPDRDHLEQWLKKRRQEQKTEGEPRSPESESRETSSENKASEAESLNPKTSTRSAPLWRNDLSLILPHLTALGSTASSSWQAEPGARWQLLARLNRSAPHDATHLWLGLRLLAISGFGRIGDDAGRFSWVYIGPSFGWEWLAETASRQRLTLGLAGVSRQGEAGSGDRPLELRTRDLGWDGAGFWMEYTYAFEFAEACEWEFTLGTQSGAKTLLSFLGFGLSLSLGERSTGS